MTENMKEIKINIVFIIICLLSILLFIPLKSAFSQIEDRNIINDDYNFIRKNNLKIKKVYKDSVNTSVFYYNKNGFISKIIFNPENTYLKHIDTYEYDTINKITKIISSGKQSNSIETYFYLNSFLARINIWDSIEKLQISKKFEYNDYGDIKLRAYVENNVEDRYNYTYFYDTIISNKQKFIFKKVLCNDTLNTLIISQYNSENIEFFRKIIYVQANLSYTYFFNNKTGKNEAYFLHSNPDDYEYTVEQQFVYDSNGKLLKSIDYFNNEIRMISEFFYDYKGLLTKEIKDKPGSKNNDRHIIFYEYEY